MMIVSAGSRVGVANNDDLFRQAEVVIISRQRRQSMIHLRALAAMDFSGRARRAGTEVMIVLEGRNNNDQ